MVCKSFISARAQDQTAQSYLLEWNANPFALDDFDSNYTSISIAAQLLGHLSIAPLLACLRRSTLSETELQWQHQHKPVATIMSLSKRTHLYMRLPKRPGRQSYQVFNSRLRSVVPRVNTASQSIFETFAQIHMADI